MATINFKGKEIVRNYHLAVPYHELVPDEKKSFPPKADRDKNVSLNDNLIIYGDNLLALKALLPTYAGKVKCIYIDPPYNTGNEKWAYNDNVNSPMMKEWLGKVVDKDDLTRHDKWLCMMMPRLKLLRELLVDDGVIFVSIDNNEAHRLRLLMDDVFDDNFISQLAWKGKSGAEDDDYFRTQNEHILCYAKDKNKFIAGEQIKFDERFPEYDPIKKRNYKIQLARKWGSNSRRVDRPNLYYPITAPTGESVYPLLPTGEDGCWRWDKKRMEREISDGNIEFERDGENWVVYQKIWATREGEEPRTKKFNTWLDDVGSTSTGTDEIKEIFNEKVFEHPKPTTLIKRLIEMAGVGENDIILDSFAGSGTTAHAVLDLNKESGNRKFILVQLPEEIEKDKPAYKLGFRQIIDITTERVRRVIKGVKGAKDENLKKGFGGTFSYFELGKPIDAERILKGEDLPSFVEMARYIFYTATGEEFNDKKINEKISFIGESKEYKVYLLYKSDLEYLKSTALTLDFAQKLGKFTGKKRLVFAPTKYLDHEHLERLGVEFAQLPFDIYKMAK